MNNTNNPQQQYRILRSNETVQKGDEFRSDSSWLDCRSTIGQTVQQNVDVEPQTFDIDSFRRPLPIMPGYRYLEASDVIQEGDEYNTVNWQRWSSATDSPLSRGDVGYFRRKIEQVQEAPKHTVYLVLGNDEIIQEGDYFVCQGGFKNTVVSSIGLTVEKAIKNSAIKNFVRPCDNWRFLKTGETILSTDYLSTDYFVGPNGYYHKATFNHGFYLKPSSLPHIRLIEKQDNSTFYNRKIKELEDEVATLKAKLVKINAESKID